MTTMYHSTPETNVGSILRQGLLREGSRIYGGGSIDGAVHLAVERDSFESLAAFCWDAEWVATFAVDVDGLDLVAGMDGPESRMYRGTIEPGRLRLLGFWHDELYETKGRDDVRR